MKIILMILRVILAIWEALDAIPVREEDGLLLEEEAEDLDPYYM